MCLSHAVFRGGWEAIETSARERGLEYPLVLTHTPDGRHPLSVAKEPEFPIETRQQAFADGAPSRRLLSDQEFEQLEPVVTKLLSTIPENWATFDYDSLTSLEGHGLGLLVFAGVVSQRFWTRGTIANQPTPFELRLEVTGEGEGGSALERAGASLDGTCGDALRHWQAGWTDCVSPFYGEANPSQEWRLTQAGVLYKQADGGISDSLDFICRRGLYGPGYWIRVLSSTPNRLTDDLRREIRSYLNAGGSMARFARPTVPAQIKLLEARELDRSSRAVITDERQNQPAEPVGMSKPTGPKTRPKRGPHRSDACLKLIAALTKHHQYQDVSSLNYEPIKNNQLARDANVSKARASEFFKKEFKGHQQYRIMCSRKDVLICSLRLLNDEVRSYALCGSDPNVAK